MQDWKMMDQRAGVENTGLENVGLENDGLENAGLQVDGLNDSKTEKTAKCMIRCNEEKTAGLENGLWDSSCPLLPVPQSRHNY